MSTLVHVSTYTHSVTFVTDKMLTSLRRIIIWIGLDPWKLTADWEALERGIRRWLETRYLLSVVLEVYRPSSAVLIGRWDFEIEYSFGIEDDGTMWTDTDAIKFAIRKCGIDPAECEYRVVAITREGRPDVEGWWRTTLRSTDGFVRHSVGTTIGASPLVSRAAYWRRI
jgi:hypothetical protein